jgi:hypothetical protein
METVRCKYVCREIVTREGTRDPEGKLYEVRFSPVTSGSPENEEFYKWTPAGELKIGTIKRMPFEVGKSYYLDITEAPD